jgi:ribose-phosphate pyrophosphokinase
MIKIFRNPCQLNSKFFLFPGGEVGVKLDTNNLAFKHEQGDIKIVARIQNSNDFFELALVKDALEQQFVGIDIVLYLYYVPYARQDRVCVGGESFSLKVFANLINSLKFKYVVIADPHSDVCGAVIDNCVRISQFDIIHQFEAFTKRVLKGVMFVAPDAGGNKKTSELAKYYGHSDFIRADKLRDLSTGNIKETIVYSSDLYQRDVVIADDICDGGRTFIELAKALKKKNAGKIILYVTHGIFSKGTDVLYDGGIDEIFTTNSFYDTWPAGVSIPAENVLDLEKHFLI